MVRAIAHGTMDRRNLSFIVDSLSYFSFQPAPQLVKQRLWNVVSYLWDGAYKRTLLQIRKSSPCGGSRFPLSLSEWSFTICHITINKMCSSASLNKTFPSFLNSNFDHNLQTNPKPNPKGSDGYFHPPASPNPFFLSFHIHPGSY